MLTGNDEPAVIVRPATPADIETLGGFGTLLMALHHQLDGKRFIRATADTPAKYAHFLESELARPDAILLVAEESGLLSGYVYAAREGFDYMALRGPAGVIYDLFVASERRRQGLGRLLLNAAMEKLQALGCERFVLSTAFQNEAARALFTSMGFRPTMVEMTREAEAPVATP